MLNHAKKMGVAAPMVECLMGERGTRLLCVSSHYNAVSLCIIRRQPGSRSRVRLSPRRAGSRSVQRVKRGLGWRSPGPIYIMLEVGESAGRDRKRQKGRERETGASRSKNNKGARETATWRIQLPRKARLAMLKTATEKNATKDRERSSRVSLRTSALFLFFFFSKERETGISRAVIL